ncbi:uncharacterized, partial [Tachysurus ichikawai]
CDQNVAFVYSRYCGSALIDLAGGLCHVLSPKIRAFSHSFTSRQQSLFPPPSIPLSPVWHASSVLKPLAQSISLLYQPQ